MLFFARFKEVKSGIAIFKSAAERDTWVNFKDPFSVQSNTTAENAFLKRIPITTRQAENLAGDSFDDAANYQFDPLEGVLYLACKPKPHQDVIEDNRYSLIRDLFREAAGCAYYEQIKRAAHHMYMR